MKALTFKFEAFYIFWDRTTVKATSGVNKLEIPAGYTKFMLLIPYSQLNASPHIESQNP